MSQLPPPAAAAVAQPFAGVPPLIERTLTARGFTALTPIQQAVINAGSRVQDLRLTSQTGSGKTVALGLVLLKSLLSDSLLGDEARSGSNTHPCTDATPHRAAKPGRNEQRKGPRALIIVPTRELSMQVYAELRWLYREYPELTLQAVTGGSDVRAEQKRLRHPPDVLVATPGRLLDHLRSGSLSLDSAQNVVLDEADQMLDLGFKEDLEAIVERLPKARQSHLVSATFPAQVQRLAARFQQNALHLEGTRLGAANSDIQHFAHLVLPNQRYAALVNVLLENHGRRCLVFVRRRSDATQTAEALNGDGFAALPLSGELNQLQRNRTLSQFKAGVINIMVATDVAARGLHIDDIATVIHADLPGEPDLYTHRSGRTGRAGQQGKSILIVSPSERRRAERMLSVLKISARWTAPPSARDIRQQTGKETRRRLHEELASAASEGQDADLKQLEHAARLLENYPAEQVIAALLKLSEPRLPRAPHELQPVSLKHALREPAARATHKSPGSFVRFLLNWGEQQGATRDRVLSHVCRRGDIQSSAVGIIDVGLNATTVEVHKQVARAFATRVKKPDRRDPKVRIVMDDQVNSPPKRGNRVVYDARSGRIDRSKHSAQSKHSAKSKRSDPSERPKHAKHSHAERPARSPAFGRAEKRAQSARAADAHA